MQTVQWSQAQYLDYVKVFISQYVNTALLTSACEGASGASNDTVNQLTGKLQVSFIHTEIPTMRANCANLLTYDLQYWQIGLHSSW